MEVENQTKKRWPKLCLAAGCVIGVLFAICAIYLNQEYRAIDVNEYLTSSQTLSVSEEDFGLFFDGPCTDRAIVFYQGAKVEATAYAPILTQLAEEGIDCFLVEMPYNIAFFDADKAEMVSQPFHKKNSGDRLLMQ